MSPTIQHSYQQVVPATLDAVEQRIGRPIPTEYRAFLLEHNGGYPEPTDFEITHRNGRVERISMGWFFPVEIEGSLDLEKQLHTYRDRLPDEVFPFGCDPGGDLLGIVTHGERAGQIWFWDHEEEAEEDEAPGWDNLYYVAPDFAAFLAGLK